MACRRKDHVIHIGGVAAVKNPTGEGDRENARHEYEKNIKNEKKVNQNFQKILLRRLDHDMKPAYQDFPFPRYLSLGT